MNHYFDALQELLLAESPQFTDFQCHLRDKQRSLVGIELAQSRVLLHTSLVYQAFTENQAGTSDLAILLRQVMRVFHEELILNKPTWKSLEEHQHEVSFRLVDEDGERVRLRALPWECTWPGCAKISGAPDSPFHSRGCGPQQENSSRFAQLRKKTSATLFLPCAFLILTWG